MLRKAVSLLMLVLLLLSLQPLVFAAKFSLGDTVEVINTGASGLVVRDAPAGNAIGKKYDGSRGMVLAGPQSASLGGVVYTWWKVRWGDDALEGWSAEGYPGGVDYLKKVTVSPSTKFSVGNLVKVSTGGPNLIVRTDPPPSSDLSYKGIVADGTVGKVVGGPFYGVPQGTSGFYHFWKVDYLSIVGWSAEDWLTKVVGEPTITSSLRLDQSAPYYVGNTITARFTITNRASASFTFDVLTVGGRDPDNQVADFTWVRSITLSPSSSYNYQGTLTLTKVGNYHFFCAYRTPWGDWNTAIPTEGGATNTLDIYVNSTPTPQKTLAIYSSPSGVTFTVDGVSRTTPWSATYSQGASVSLVMPSTHSVGAARYYWDRWSDGITSRSRTVTMNTDITLTAYFTGPYYQLTVTSSPITGIPFTINGAPKTTSYTEWLLQGSYTIEMPATYSGYTWSHWLEDGDTNRIKTFTLSSTKTLTAVYTTAPPPNQPPMLSSGYVTPSSGDISTVFEYYITYADPEGDAPTTKYVYIDGSAYIMTKISGDYVSGAVFRYSTTLSAGSHNYYFYFEDSVHGHVVRLPTTGTYSGPNVSPPPAPMSITFEEGDHIKVIIQEGWRIRTTPEIREDNIIKILPTGSTGLIIAHQDNGKYADGFYWWRVRFEVGSETYEGWCAENGLMKYKLTHKDQEVLDTREKRINAIREAIEDFRLKGGFGLRGKIITCDQNFFNIFPPELILAIIAQETGGVNYDNTAKGDGVMQVTIASGYHRSRKNCDETMYVNTVEGIRENIKDGLMLLYELYTLFSNGDQIGAVWRYNGGLDPYWTYGDFRIYYNKDNKLVLKEGITEGTYSFRRSSFYDPPPKDPEGKDYKHHAEVVGQGDKDYLRKIASHLKENGRVETDFGKVYVNPDLANTFEIAQAGVDNVMNVNKLDEPTKCRDIPNLNPFIGGDDNEWLPGDCISPTKIRLTQVTLHSPVELRVYDSQGRVTGVVNGEIREEIPNSIFDEENKTVIIIFSYDVYRYEVVGIGGGTYGLVVVSIEEEKATTFNATQIPVSVNATHQYSIDWLACSHGEEGVTVQVDSDGDGLFEHTFTSDSELTQSEFLAQIALYTFSIVWEEETFIVSVESNSTVSNFAFNQPSKEISFNVTGSDGTVGFCNVTIPKALLYAELGEWNVLIDGAPVPPTITENATHSCLYFTYTHSTHKIQIIGTWVIGSPPDTNPPLIGTPSQEPAPDKVMPDQAVKVSVSVTDMESGVKNVILSYTTNGGATWNNLTMLYNATVGLYQATIPAFPSGTTICYKIIAYDNANNFAKNDNAGQYYCYTVNPPPPPPLSVSISPLSASILEGQSVTFTSTVSGGYTPYSYQWYLNGNPVSGANATSWTFTPTTGGFYYYVYLKVTDAKGNTAQSETARVSVATVPVGGYSVAIDGHTIARPLMLYFASVAILSTAFAVIRRKARRKPK